MKDRLVKIRLISGKGNNVAFVCAIPYIQAKTQYNIWTTILDVTQNNQNERNKRIYVDKDLNAMTYFSFTQATSANNNISFIDALHGCDFEIKIKMTREEITKYIFFDMCH